MICGLSRRHIVPYHIDNCWTSPMLYLWCNVSVPAEVPLYVTTINKGEAGKSAGTMVPSGKESYHNHQQTLLLTLFNNNIHVCGGVRTSTVWWKDRLRVGVDGDVLIKFKDHPSGTTVGVKHYIPVFHSPAPCWDELRSFDPSQHEADSS